MDQVYPDAALVPILRRFLVGDFHFHLFASPVTIDQSTTLAALLAAEATFTGYAVATVLATDFTSSSTSGHQGSVLAPAISFSNTSGSPQDIYGYFITDTTDAILIAAAAFDGAPISVANAGSYPVVPIFGSLSQYAT